MRFDVGVVRIDILLLCVSFTIMNSDASIPSCDLKNHGRPLSATACVWPSFLCSTTEVRIFHDLWLILRGAYASFHPL